MHPCFHVRLSIKKISLQRRFEKGILVMFLLVQSIGISDSLKVARGERSELKVVRQGLWVQVVILPLKPFDEPL